MPCDGFLTASWSFLTPAGCSIARDRATDIQCNRQGEKDDQVFIALLSLALLVTTVAMAGGSYFVKMPGETPMGVVLVEHGLEDDARCVVALNPDGGAGVDSIGAAISEVSSA